jgi:parvulin-like peptidyl-prolyl isomerase
MPFVRRLLALAALALLAASCSTADTLASVNGNEITKADLNALRPSYAEGSSLNAEQVRQDLTLLIVLEAVQDAALDQFGYEIAESDIADRLANPPSRYASVIAPAEQFADVTEQAIRASAIQSLVRDAVVPELARQELGGFDALITERPEEVTRSCVRHISTATFAEAQTVLERLQAGEDFVAVAAEVSLDQASIDGLIAGADGDCLVWLSRAGREFANLAATAPLNEFAGPVATDNDWNIIRVEERLAPASTAELEADAMEYFDPDFISALYTPWLNDVVRAANIDVSPTVGRWSEVGIGIAPPGE